MIKLLIVDDEPLVQIGIKSMLDWNQFDIELCETAMNGEKALKIIENQKPEIVLCDIKMPIMTGLELIKICRQRYENLPLFIFLTSYEEFSLVQEAIKHQAFDYLIKLDITSETLSETIQKALAQVYQYKNKELKSSTSHLQFFYEKFMIRLLNNLFVDQKQFRLQAKELQLDFSASKYVVALCTIIETDKTQYMDEKLLSLCLSTTQMVENLVKKHMSCFVATLDTRHFCIIFKLDDRDFDIQRSDIKNALMSSFSMAYNYFNVHLCACLGRPYEDSLMLSDSYQEARQLQALKIAPDSIHFFSDYSENNTTLNHSTFNLGLFKNDIRLAFESYDGESFGQTIDALIYLFKSQPNMYLQAIDAACNVLYLTLSLLPTSRDHLDIIYEDADGYRSIYKKTTIDQVIQWLEILKNGICDLLVSQHKNYKNHMIKTIQDYIDSHITDKLSLNTIASLFGISPNYLSQLFKKTTGVGFNEYITAKKIALAKIRLMESDLKIYEIAEELGFESAFYFSKVFKKVEGCPPREFIQKNTSEDEYV
jgi:two-component system response regulator YesN